jgi:hypothetical protein
LAIYELECDEGSFLNAKAAKALQRYAKDNFFSAFLCENLCVLCVEIGLTKIDPWALTQALSRAVSNLIKGHIPDRVLPPILIVKMPPLSLIHGEPFRRHRIAQ